MQGRMKNHQLTLEEINELLGKATIGHLGMVDQEGAPYVLPLHFVYRNGKIYFHGLPQGEKITNLVKDNRVCFQVEEMRGLLIDPDGDACNTNTEYHSVVIRGTGGLVNDASVKEEVLNAIVTKYTPQFTGQQLPPNMLRATAVVEITVTSCTGKYYK